MSKSVAAVLKSILSLTPAEQRELIEAVEDRNRDDDDLGLDPEFIAEIRRRSAEYDAGKVKTVPWSDVRQSLLDELKNAQ